MEDLSCQNSTFNLEVAKSALPASGEFELMLRTQNCPRVELKMDSILISTP